jgi:hypothetical protein
LEHRLLDPMRTEGGAIQKTQAELAEIAGRTRTDRGRSRIEYVRREGTTVHQAAKYYTDTYARFFAHLRDELLRLLEIGVASGASLRMWEEFFPAHGSSASTSPRTLVRKRASERLLDGAASHEPRTAVAVCRGQRLLRHRGSTHDLRAALWRGYLHEDSTIERLKQQVDALHDQAQAPRIVEALVPSGSRPAWRSSARPSESRWRGPHVRLGADRVICKQR